MTSPIPNVCFVIKKKLSLLSHTVIDHRRGRPVENVNYRPELTNIEGKNKVDMILFEDNYVEYDKFNSVSQGINGKLL